MRVTERMSIPLPSLTRTGEGLTGAAFRLLDAGAGSTRAAAPVPQAMMILPAAVATPAERRRAAVQTGRKLLDGLDRLRLAQLGGGGLADAVRVLGEEQSDQPETEDPALDSILDAIRLRAEVELAKLQRR